MRHPVSRPNPSPGPAARISVSYDTDVDGAAEVLLAVLRRLPRLGEPVHGADHDETDVV
jgi:hypothetical protein